MVSLKREKMLGFAFTLVAMLLYVGIYAFFIAVLTQMGKGLSIENGTLLALQILAFICLLLGMILRKENLILGTLVAALVSTAVSYLVGDVTELISTPIDFSLAWYLPSYQIINIVSDVGLALGTVSFLVFLLTGRHNGSRATASSFFIFYLTVCFLGLVFLVIGSCLDTVVLALLAEALVDYLAVLAYIVNINAYFFHPALKAYKGQAPELLALQKEQKKKGRDSLSSVGQVIGAYQSEVLSSAFREKDGRTELTVDLQKVPLYEDCSGGTLLNSSIYAFVEDIAFALADGQEFTLRFLYPAGTAPEEKAKIASIFKAHYAIKYKNIRDRLTKEMVLAISFVFIGFLLITIHLPYVAANSDSVYGEMLDIFGWVFTWEAVEILCVNSLDNQNELKRYRSLYNAEVADEKDK